MPTREIVKIAGRELSGDKTEDREQSVRKHIGTDYDVAFFHAGQAKVGALVPDNYPGAL